MLPVVLRGAAALAALLLAASAARATALEIESGVGAQFLVAAQRARDLPLVLAQVADPAVAIDRELLLRLTLALGQDGDRPIEGAVAMGSVVAITTVDALSPAGTSRRAHPVTGGAPTARDGAPTTASSAKAP